MEKSNKEPKIAAPVAESKAQTISADTKVPTADHAAKPSAAEPGVKNAAKPIKKADSNMNKAVSSNSQPISKWPIRLGFSLCFIIASTALGASYWLYTQSVLLKSELASKQLQTQQINGTVNTSLSYAKAKIESLEKQQQNNANSYQELTATKSTIEQLQTQVNALAQRSPNHWMASEANYLVRMASRKIWLESDLLTAVQLLESADERIAAMQNPALLPIRKALSQDIAELKSIKQLDISSHILALDNLIAKLDSLPLNANKTLAPTPVSTDAQLSSDVSDWQANLSKSWQAFSSSLVTIRKRTTDLEPLLSPEQQWYLTENIKNRLLQAQSALQHKDNQHFQQSLAMAKQWLSQYFDLHQSNTLETIETINKLAEIKLTPIAHKQLIATPLLEQLVTFGDISTSGEPTL
ncbi:uroporphyrinogen-III C-methyltransferase [Shewanella sp.]|uniref:uroporphyrinogen-III C-methyltransferase n=1 Tax=Shewanella sp. TaxID=50422 RepID=UPI0040548EC8